MSRPVGTALAIALFVALVVVEVVNVVVLLLTWDLDRATFGVSPQVVVQSGVTAAVFGGVGLLLAMKRPRNAIGWLFLAIALNVAAGMDGAPANLLGRYALYSMRHEDALPLTALAASLAQAAWVAMFACVALLLLLFPYGRLPSRRWRWVVALLAASAVAAWVGGTTAPGPIADPFGGYRNPLGVNVMGPVDGVLFASSYLMLVALVAAVASLLGRLRRSRGIERRQYALFTGAGLVLAVGVAATQVADAVLGTRASNLVSIVPAVAAGLLPIATAVAILRYRLYEIDRIVSRTLVYGSLTLVLGATYVGLVLAGQALFSSFAGGSHLAIAVSTLVVAALFLPLRSWVQRVVDRRFYRRRYDAQRTLEGFGARLRDRVDLPSLALELCGAVDDTVQPAHVSLWLREAER